MGAVDAFRAPDRAAQMGVQWQRVMFDWSAIQRGSPATWDVGLLDVETLRRERDAGRPAIGVLMSTPSWASGTSDAKSPPLGLDTPPDDPRNVWATWVRRIVAQYAGVVDTWVMWNEPDVWSDETSSRQWDGTPEQYYLLLKAGYVAAKEANPNATVLTAGFTYWWDSAYGREQYFSRVLRAADADPTAPAHGWYFDGAVLQLYNDPRGLFDAPLAFHAIMRGRGFDKPIWINETNVVPWDDPVAPLSAEHFRSTQDEQASYLVQATAYALASGVSHMEVFKLLDDPYFHNGVDQAFGFVRADADRTTRPAFKTFQVLLKDMAPTERAQLVDGGPINVVYLEQPAFGRRMTVLWNTGPTPRAYSLPALGETAQAMNKFGVVRPLEVDAEGQIRLTLPAATAHSIPGYPNAAFIGGDPVIVLEPLPATYQPLAATPESFPPDGWALVDLSSPPEVRLPLTTGQGL
jgi:hypothetical protein